MTVWLISPFFWPQFFSSMVYSFIFLRFIRTLNPTLLRLSQLATAIEYLRAQNWKEPMEYKVVTLFAICIHMQLMKYRRYKR